MRYKIKNDHVQNMKKYLNIRFDVKMVSNVRKSNSVTVTKFNKKANLIGKLDFIMPITCLLLLWFSRKRL